MARTIPRPDKGLALGRLQASWQGCPGVLAICSPSWASQPATLPAPEQGSGEPLGAAATTALLMGGQATLKPGLGAQGRSHLPQAGTAGPRSPHHNSPLPMLGAALLTTMACMVGLSSPHWATSICTAAKTGCSVETTLPAPCSPRASCPQWLHLMRGFSWLQAQCLQAPLSAPSMGFSLLLR